MNTMELKLLTEMLDLDGFEVVAAVSDAARKIRRLTVTPRVVLGICPHCHGASDDRHACHDREVSDLPLAGWESELVVRLFQFRCSSCDRFFTPPYPAP